MTGQISVTVLWLFPYSWLDIMQIVSGQRSFWFPVTVTSSMYTIFEVRNKLLQVASPIIALSWDATCPLAVIRLDQYAGPRYYDFAGTPNPVEV